jgi:type I restriction enzyme, S subunit
MAARDVPFPSLLAEVIDNRGRTCPTAGVGFPLIATNCIRNESLFPVYENVRYVTDETYKTWFRGHPRPGDLIFVTKGTPGRVCWTPDPVSFCIAQDMVALRPDERKVNP